MSKTLVTGLLLGFFLVRALRSRTALSPRHTPGRKSVRSRLSLRRSSFRTMETEAITLGKQLIERERELDDMFASKTITKDKLQQSLQAIASLRGRIRQVHLPTHLVQAEILNADQIDKYDERRGYTRSGNSTPRPPQQH